MFQPAQALTMTSLQRGASLLWVGTQLLVVLLVVHRFQLESRTFFDVLALAFWGGLTQTEIAERTGTPLGTVKSRVRLGMEKLRQHLAEVAT